MIKSIYVDNFKALNEFEIELMPLTVLIGGNASGKSSVLQSLDLVCNFAYKDIDVYLSERGWNLYDLKSQLNSKRNITFRTLIEIPVEDVKKELVWEFVLSAAISLNKVSVVSETVIDKNKGYPLLSVNPQGITRYNFEGREKEKIPGLLLNSSMLKTIDVEKDKKKYPELVALKNFMVASDSFELLTPEKMRQSSRGRTDNIGIKGEKLPAFIQGLSQEKKREFLKRLRTYIGFVDSVDTMVKGRPGWIEMTVKEKFDQTATKIKSTHVSDGLMRIIALSCLAEIDKANGLMLLDEIEDGINPYLAAKVVESLSEVVEESNRQVIVTTHSSVMLDYFGGDSVIFLWRKKNGNISSAKLFRNTELRDMLEYMFPGEVWINMTEKEIVEKLEDGIQ